MRARTILSSMALLACGGGEHTSPLHDASALGGGYDAASQAMSDTGTFATNQDASVARTTDAQVDAAAASNPPSQWVMGYYVGYQIDRYPLADIDWSALTHIALAPLVVKADGGFDTTFSGFGSDADGAAFAKQLASVAHQNGVHALLMLGGAGASDNVKTALEKSTTGFATQLIDLMNSLGFDGIDLDVEATNFNLDDFITLASALRAAAPSILLSTPGASVQYGTKVDAKTVTFAGYLDRFFIQSYQGGSAGLFTGGNSAGGTFQSYFYGPLGGASALTPYTIDYALDQLAQAGIPKNKLGMGIAFYAACYKTPDTTPPGGQPVSAPRMPAAASSDWCWDCGIGGGDNVASYNYFYAGDSLFAQASDAEKKRDQLAQEPYLSFAAPKQDALCGGDTQYVIYEDEISLEAKGTFSRSNGYGGTILWTLQQGWLPQNAAGGRARNALMQALKKGFLTP